MVLTVVETECSDDEYNEFEEQVEDAEEEEVPDGAAAAATLLAGPTKQDAGGVVDLVDQTAPAAHDIMAVTDSAIKAAHEPASPQLVGARELNFDSQHTPVKNQIQRFAAGRKDIPDLKIVGARLQQLHNTAWDDLSESERNELLIERGTLLGAAPAGKGNPQPQKPNFPPFQLRNGSKMAEERLYERLKNARARG
jgi:hypothetical protein